MADRVHIERMEAFAVRVPLKTRLLTTYGSRRSVSRTVLRLYSNTGHVGYGEVHGRVTPAMLMKFEKLIVGKSPWKINEITRPIRNWSYYPYQAPQPMMGAIEIACLDLQGKIVEAPVYELLGGRIHPKVPVSAYIFYAHPDDDGSNRIHSVEEVVEAARSLVDCYGFRTLKLKGGYFAPEHDLAAMNALHETFGSGHPLRIDPQGNWTVATAIRIGRALERLNMEYFEDPCWSVAEMAQVRSRVSIPLATNMCVAHFDELMPAVSMKAIDIVLSDLWYYGGIRATQALEQTCVTMGLDIGMHSGSELGIGWAAMVHTASSLPNRKLAIDCMHVHVADDVVVPGALSIQDGEIAPPEGPGLGIEVDETKLKKYAALAEADRLADRLLNPMLADDARPGWLPQMPAW